MNSAKLDNQLNLALQVSNTDREKTNSLDVGYDYTTNEWELIIRHSGNIDQIISDLNVKITKLLNNYAIVTLKEDAIDQLSEYPEIEFIEKPYSLTFATTTSKIASCIQEVQQGDSRLDGTGVLIAIIDSGIDYSHPDFINADNTSRILSLWDQTIPGNPPDGYSIGTLYSNADINAAIKVTNPIRRIENFPSIDTSGHGTHVAGIAAGNGRASNGRNKGVAPNSELLVVKLGFPKANSFPSTVELIQAINFCINTATTEKKPLVISLSFGNNYGSHDGLSLLEQYINDISAIWKTSIVIGTGNEGASARHTNGIVKTDQSALIEIAVPSTELSFSLQIWKNYYDNISIEIISPSGQRSGLIKELLGKQEFVLDKVKILLYYAKPKPINIAQEIYLEFIPQDTYLTVGLWNIRLAGNKVVTGEYDLWLPSGAKLISNTKFTKPTPDITLTTPSTAYRAISVGAYNAITNSYASFSGRGYTRMTQYIKPELCAPGVNILSTAVNGGYTQRTGTSMATPFVSGAAALLMQWGIVENNDPYLYGEKLKAYLIKGARPLPGYRNYPNNSVGWGALCVSNSLPL
ncbi:hypothetical protein lbkm_2645 [Lachnospiraceae bacterium KM106-2]|nr:hypothetical protein lbkm_2645 [Lachnospiraceae bacterium KM106-2]